MASTSDCLIDDKRLLARVEDALECAENGRASRFIGFLDERQTVLVRGWMERHARHTRWCLFGGYEEAERVFLGIFTDYDNRGEESFPVTPVGFSYRPTAQLTHRDVLGSLMGCGIAREKVGDILCTDGLAVVFVHSDLAAFISRELTKIGREGVCSQCPFQGELPQTRAYLPLSGTVASVRLDAILKVLLGCSREKASDMIRLSLVSINHQLCMSVSTVISAGDLISVKGKGRFVIDDLSGLSSKGRVIVQARKYV